jgi:hypothetical protein
MVQVTGAMRNQAALQEFAVKKNSKNLLSTVKGFA